MPLQQHGCQERIKPPMLCPGELRQVSIVIFEVVHSLDCTLCNFR